MTVSEAPRADVPNSKAVPVRPKIPRRQRIIAAEVESCWDGLRHDTPARGKCARLLPFLRRQLRPSNNSFATEWNLGTIQPGEAGSPSSIGEQRIIRD